MLDDPNALLVADRICLTVTFGNFERFSIGEFDPRIDLFRLLEAPGARRGEGEGESLEKFDNTTFVSASTNSIARLPEVSSASCKR